MKKILFNRKKPIVSPAFAPKTPIVRTLAQKLGLKTVNLKLVRTSDASLLPTRPLSPLTCKLLELGYAFSQR